LSLKSGGDRPDVKGMVAMGRIDREDGFGGGGVVSGIGGGTFIEGSGRRDGPGRGRWRRRPRGPLRSRRNRGDQDRAYSSGQPFRDKKNKYFTSGGI